MLTSSQLAEELGLSKMTVLRLANAGKIPAYRIDNGRGDFRFDLEEVKAAMRVAPDDSSEA